MAALPLEVAPVERADFAWHLRAWGRRVLAAARAALAARYPTYAEFEPVRRKGRRRAAPQIAVRYRPRPPTLLQPDADGQVSASALNAEFDSLYLEEEANPRWVAKPAVAYLWARTVRCANCRTEVPLLKTRWLCKTARKRVLLTIERREDGAGVEFGIEADVPVGTGTAARRREHDRTLGAGTMSGSGATCPCCGTIATMKDLRAAGRAGRLGERMTAVVVDGQQGKEYRLPTAEEFAAARVGSDDLDALYADVPFGLPNEPTPSEQSLGMRVPRYGFDTWRSLFTGRQLLALGTFVREIRHCSEEIRDYYPDQWREALVAYLALAIFSKLTDYSRSTICSRGHNGGREATQHFRPLCTADGVGLLPNRQLAVQHLRGIRPG